MRKTSIMIRASQLPALKGLTKILENPSVNDTPSAHIPLSVLRVPHSVSRLPTPIKPKMNMVMVYTMMKPTTIQYSWVSAILHIPPLPPLLPLLILVRPYKPPAVMRTVTTMNQVGKNPPAANMTNKMTKMPTVAA